MPKFTANIYNASVEIRYGDGFLYLDRCGQAIMDIMRLHPGWVTTDVDTTGGKMERFDKNYQLLFSADRFNFVSKSLLDNTIFDIAQEANSLWKIIKNNFGICDTTRTGVRFLFLLPTPSKDETELLLSRCKFNINLPDNLEKYKVKTRSMTSVLIYGDYEYRISVGGVTRYESIDPSGLFKGDPRALSRNQQQARVSQLKKVSSYKADPMYAVQMDIDCYSFGAGKLSLHDQMVFHHDYVKQEFFEIISSLR